MPFIIRTVRAWCAQRSPVIEHRHPAPRRIASLAFALCLSCGSSQTEHGNVDASAALALSEPCGNSQVEADEECDPVAEGWQESCDAECHRTSYVSCEQASDCEGLNANCAAYTREAGQQFCAPFCERDADCPAVPGFEARCNFAWCTLSCSDGSCPHGMACVRAQALVDERGEQIGQLDVCVIDPR
jgi:hypothetical protein